MNAPLGCVFALDRSCVSKRSLQSSHPVCHLTGSHGLNIKWSHTNNRYESAYMHMQMNIVIIFVMPLVLVDYTLNTV